MKRAGGQGIKESGMDGTRESTRRWGVALVLALVAYTGLWAPAARAAETTTYVLTDVQGTVLAREDAQGNIIARYDYRPYGKHEPGPRAAGLGYTGHVEDLDTGLVYMQQRYYDPEVGRFLSVDPISVTVGNIFSINRYLYVNGNPVKNVDPDGRQAFVGWSDAQIHAARNNPEQAGAFVGLAADFTPVVGDIKGIVEAVQAPTVTNISAAAIGLLPVAGDGLAKAIKLTKYVKGGKFSKITKKIAADRAGRKCEYCGVETTPAKKSQRGVSPPRTEAQTDHVESRSEGGTNSPDNAAHSCRECNQRMSNKPKPHPREQSQS